MAFKPFDFTFTPPATVTTPPPASPTVLSSKPTVGGPTSGNQSRAGVLISKLNDLTDMSRYLQQAIIARTGKIAIEINPAVDPDMARALTSIYGTSTPPNFITVTMYDQLLNAHLGALQLEMAVGNDSSVQANPIQVGDLMTAVKTLDNHLTNAPGYNNWLPLQLASLKSDSVVFQSWQSALATYPAFYTSGIPTVGTFQPTTIQASGIDVDENIYNYQVDALDRFGTSYAQIYKTMAGSTAVAHDLNSIVNEYFNQPLQNMLRISALFNTMKGLIFKTSMGDLQDDMVNFIFSRLASDVSGMLAHSDQLVSLAVSPLKGNLGTIGQIMSAAQSQAAKLGVMAGGVMAGMSKANSDVLSNPYNKVNGTSTPLNVPGLGAVSNGLKYLGETLDWAQREVQGSLELVDTSFRQLLERRMKHQNDRNQLMSAMSSLDTMTQLADGVANEFQKGTVTANSNPEQKQEAVNRILASLQTNIDTTFTSSNSDGNTEVTVNTSDMPPAPAGVVRVLQGSGIESTIRLLKV